MKQNPFIPDEKLVFDPELYKKNVDDHAFPERDPDEGKGTEKEEGNDGHGA